MPVQQCTSLDQVRENIDRLDAQIVALIAEREAYVRQAPQFKRTPDDVRAPARAEQVVARVKRLAAEQGADPRVVEQVYRAMIAAFIALELDDHARRQQ